MFKRLSWCFLDLNTGTTEQLYHHPPMKLAPWSNWYWRNRTNFKWQLVDNCSNFDLMVRCLQFLLTGFSFNVFLFNGKIVSSNIMKKYKPVNCRTTYGIVFCWSHLSFVSHFRLHNLLMTNTIVYETINITNEIWCVRRFDRVLIERWNIWLDPCLALKLAWYYSERTFPRPALMRTFYTLT